MRPFGLLLLPWRRSRRRTLRNGLTGPHCWDLQIRRSLRAWRGLRRALLRRRVLTRRDTLALRRVLGLRRVRGMLPCKRILRSGDGPLSRNREHFAHRSYHPSVKASAR